MLPTLPLLQVALPSGVRAGFTTRAGPDLPRSAASGDYAGFNLGDHVGDDPARVAAHRESLRTAIGAHSLVIARQVHGADVVVVTGASGSAAPDRTFADGPPVADALVTTVPGMALGVLVADCVPVLLADPVAGVVAVAHAGRQGLVAGVVPAALAAMRELGATDIRAWLGPAICGACYEVPDAMADDVTRHSPAAGVRTPQGSRGLDVTKGVLAQLATAGVGAVTVQRCTAEDPQLFSYRRDGRTGRSAGVIMLSPNG